jgi:hypothetical protein
MTKRYRLELTELELECLFIVADEGCERADAGCILSMGEGFAENRRAARRGRDKLAALIDERDADEREREQRDAQQFATSIHPALLDGSHDPERADCACDWCEEGRTIRADRHARVISGTGDSGERRELAALARGLRE